MIRRRDFLSITAAAGLTGCAARSHVINTPPAALRRFPKVNVSPDREIRTVVGLRPFRPSGFVVNAEKAGEKVIVHNYGHGGGGMTLSWGTAHLAVEEVAKTGDTRVAVLGCGGVGLATARLLQHRGIAVSIYAKALPPETTSNIAGAQWFPFSVYDHDKTTPAFVEQFVRACRFSYRWYQNLVGDHYGVRWIPNYRCSDEQGSEQGLTGRESPIRELIPGMRDLTAAENPFPYPYVREFYTMLIEPAVYLAAVTQDFRLAGGTIVVRDFASREQVLALPERTVVNCTGLGARDVFGDTELTPIKGQLTVLVPQPEIDYVTLSGGNYMFPRRDGILLGGTHERGVSTMEPNLDAKASVLAAHTEFFSKMR